MSGFELIPSIDLLGGQGVRLTEGRYDQATVYEPDPVAAAVHGDDHRVVDRAKAPGANGLADQRRLIADHRLDQDAVGARVRDLEHLVGGKVAVGQGVDLEVDRVAGVLDASGNEAFGGVLVDAIAEGQDHGLSSVADALVVGVAGAPDPGIGAGDRVDGGGVVLADGVSAVTAVAALDSLPLHRPGRAPLQHHHRAGGGRERGATDELPQMNPDSGV